ncbi:MAG: hypothetical protein GY928_33890 [Colwellia sp.]|nr:hypothetical protein [Colwellia sp.]
MTDKKQKEKIEQLATTINDLRVEEFRIARVVWLDTTACAGWFGCHEELPEGPLKMETLGYLIEDNDNRVIVARTVGQYKAEGLLIIPKGCVVEVRMMV